MSSVLRQYHVGAVSAAICAAPAGHGRRLRKQCGFAEGEEALLERRRALGLLGQVVTAVVLRLQLGVLPVQELHQVDQFVHGHFVTVVRHG